MSKSEFVCIEGQNPINLFYVRFITLDLVTHMPQYGVNFFFTSNGKHFQPWLFNTEEKATEAYKWLLDNNIDLKNFKKDK